VIDPFDVSAVIITRGDNDLMPIIDRLVGYSEILIWSDDREDHGVYGRYELVAEALNDVVYLQDDDCSIPRATQLALLEAYEPGVLVANWGHGENPDGYEDVALVHGGAVLDRDLPARAFARYLEHFPYDDDLEREADMIVGCLTPHKYLHLPYDILPLASHPSRMCNQPWQREKKLRVTQRARAIRDGALV
jgi:hypothetical protein